MENKYLGVEQGSEEWLKIRLGKATASELAKIMASGRDGKESVGRAKYRDRLAIERITGNVIAGYKNECMQNGNDLESEAIAAYKFKTENEVGTIAFIDHPSIAMSGCSPDGIIGDKGMCQIKTREIHIHAETMRTQKIPGETIKQMSWEMDCAQRDWNDYVSFCPDFPFALQLVIIRLDRDEALIEKQRIAVIEFLREVENQELFFRSMI